MNFPEPGTYHELGFYVVKVTENWIVGIMPMIYNERIILMDHDTWKNSIRAGWCYPKFGDRMPAIVAAGMWNPEEQERPEGFIKEAFDAR